MSRRVALPAVLAVLTATLSLAFAAGARAQTVPGGHKLVQVVVSGGVTLPAGELKNFHDTGFHYDGSLIFNIPGFPIAFRPEVSFTQFKLKNALVPGTAAAGYGSNTTQLLSAIGNIEVPLAAGLYLIGGLGAMRLDSKLAATTTDETQTKLVIDAGAGFRFRLSRIDGFVEARMGTASYESGKFGYSKAQFIPITFGLAF
jgi:hypothetical protein